jgi:hypothetical protein
MSSVPLIASQWQPEDPLAGYAKMQALQTQLRASQQQQQAAQRKQQESELIRQAFVKNSGDIDKTIADVSHSPVVTPEALQALQLHSAAVEKANADASDAQLKLRAAQIDNLRGAFQPVYNLPADAPPEKLNALYQQQRARVLQAPQAYGIGDPSEVPPQFPGKEAGQFLMTSMVGESKQLEEERQRRELELKEQTDARAAATAAAELPGQKADAALKQRVLSGASPTGITAEQQAQLASTKRAQDITLRGQNLQQAKRTPDESAIETAAQSLASGDLTRLKDIASLRGDQRLLIYNRAKQLNPQFSTADVDRKIKMEDSFTNGKDGQNLQSFGTFLEHAGTASDTVNNYRNTGSPLINKPLNWISNHVAGDPNFQQFTASLEPVRKEFEGFLLGGHALYGDDRKAAETILSDSSSPAQIQAALKQMGHTVKARFNEANFRYQRTMGHPLENVLSPEALSGAQKIGISLGGNSAPSGPPAGATHIAPGSDGRNHYTNNKGEDLGVAQ